MARQDEKRETMAVAQIPALLRQLAARPDHPVGKRLHARLFGRPFARGQGRRLLILFEPHRISYASIFPFLLYSHAFAERYGAQIRLFPTEKALSGGLPKGFVNATHVLAQTWLTDPPERHTRLVRILNRLPSDTVTAYLDSSANADIRLAAHFSEVDLYFKKSLFADPTEHLRPTYGHTNLTEYYGRLYNVAQEPTDWQVPETILPRLRVAPNFLTAPHLAAAFLHNAEPPDQASRNIDLHARLGGTDKDGWYGEMRRQAARAVDDLTSLHIVSGTGISPKAFMSELQRAKICFSPFGYGEICWRDIEAIAAGAVLLKPDMAHLRTAPDLYRDDDTYVTCRWDFSNLKKKVHELLADEDRRRRIAHRAWDVAHRYLAEGGPVGTYGALFAAPGTSETPSTALQDEEQNTAS